MGSFGAHFYVGSMFTIVSFWWLYNTCKAYIKCKEERKPFRNRPSFPLTIRGHQVPVEGIIKTLLTGVATAIDLILFGADYIGEDGQFHDIWSMDHTMVYIGYLINGVVDLMDGLHATSIHDINYLTGALAFAWNGYAFYLHTDPSRHNGFMEPMMHRVPITPLLMTALMLLLEMYKRDSAVIQLVRCYFAMTFATWYFYIAFTLYSASTGHKNPNWDNNNIQNANFMVTAYGIHLVVNLIIVMTSLYVAESYMKLKTCIPWVKGHTPTPMYVEVRLLREDESTFEDNEF